MNGALSRSSLFTLGLLGTACSVPHIVDHDAGAGDADAAQVAMPDASIRACSELPCDADPTASCTDTPLGPACQCPPHYTGNGMGPLGCTPRLVSADVGNGALLPPGSDELWWFRLRPRFPITVTLPDRLCDLRATGVERVGSEDLTVTFEAYAPSLVTFTVSRGGAQSTRGLTGMRLPQVEGFAVPLSDLRSELYAATVDLDEQHGYRVFGHPDFWCASGQAFEPHTSCGAVRIDRKFPQIDSNSISGSNGENGDEFGAALSAGRWLAVGAPGEDGCSRVDSGNGCGDSGAAYIFDFQGVETAYLKASDAAAGARFGASLFADESLELVVVGAPNANQRSAGGGVVVSGAGAAYVFERVGGEWREVALLAAPTPTPEAQFGYSVGALANTILVGAPGEDAAYVYRKKAGLWAFDAQLQSDQGGSEFGTAVFVTSADGVTEALIGAPRAASSTVKSGAVHAFLSASGPWTRSREIHSGDRAEGDAFGAALAASPSGIVVIGAPGRDEGRGAFCYLEAHDEGSAAAATCVAADAEWGRGMGRSVAIREDFGALVGFEPRLDALDDSQQPQGGRIGAIQFR
jgi:hypothetical protein